MKFEHDCDQCVPLGMTEEGIDLYVCAKASYARHFGPSLVARSGNDGWEYTSQPWSMLMGTAPSMREPMLDLAAALVTRRVNQDSKAVLTLAMTQFLWEQGSRQVLTELAHVATQVMRGDNEDPRWTQVLHSLHFEAELEPGTGVGVLTLTAGTTQGR